MNIKDEFVKGLKEAASVYFYPLRYKWVWIAAIITASLLTWFDPLQLK